MSFEAESNSELTVIVPAYQLHFRFPVQNKIHKQKILSDTRTAILGSMAGPCDFLPAQSDEFQKVCWWFNLGRPINTKPTYFMNHLIPIFSTNGQSIMSGYYTKKNLLVSIQTNNSNTKSLIIANGSVAYFRKKNVNIFRCRLISAYNFLTKLIQYCPIDIRFIYNVWLLRSGQCQHWWWPCRYK